MNNKELTISATGSGQAEKWPKWKRLTTRKANPEEIGQGYTFMWEGESPEIGEEVLVSDGKSIWTDTWMEVDIFVGFEQTDYDSDCWWMPFPSLPQ